MENDSFDSSSFQLTVGPDQAGKRLDRFLSSELPQISRSLISQGIKEGIITVNGSKRKNSYKIKEGEAIVGGISNNEPLVITPEKLDLTILFEDTDLLVLSKPPNLVVHPGAGNRNGTLVNGLVYYCQNILNVGEDSVRPGIVHRLDKDTSGVMVVAKNQKTHVALSDLFKTRKVNKTYLALVNGIFKKYTGRVVVPIGRHKTQRKKMAVVEGTRGRYAASNWEVIEEFGSIASLVKVGIETGRTHQIRVHMKYLGHPVAGDELYGPKRPSIIPTRQLLHASILEFIHPFSGRKMRFKAPLTNDFQQFVDGLREKVPS